MKQNIRARAMRQALFSCRKWGGTMKKNCPYNVRVEQINQDVYEYDENGQVTFHSHKLIENQIPTECSRQCAAYIRGKCRRR